MWKWSSMWLPHCGEFHILVFITFLGGGPVLRHFISLGFSVSILCIDLNRVSDYFDRLPLKWYTSRHQQRKTIHQQPIFEYFGTNGIEKYHHNCIWYHLVPYFIWFSRFDRLLLTWYTSRLQQRKTIHQQPIFEYLGTKGIKKYHHNCNWYHLVPNFFRFSRFDRTFSYFGTWFSSPGI